MGPVIVGVPTEVKDSEHRVAMTPDGVRELVASGHRVLVQAGAGEGSSIDDDEYRRSGAEIVPTADDAWGAEMVVKVKEPQTSELGHLRHDLLLFTYLHLAAEPDVAAALIESKATGVAYETVQLADGSLPLLAPMSEVAGRMATQVGAHWLERENGGRGVLLGAGGRAPTVVTDEMVRGMKKGAVIVDVAVDQGGCVETTRETTHSDPVYEVHGVLHYAVGNIPGAVPNTSTYALTNATLPYVAAVANEGLRGAAERDPAVASGINTVGGRYTNAAVAEVFGAEAADPLALL